jgi:hypothetical protein
MGLLAILDDNRHSRVSLGFSCRQPVLLIYNIVVQPSHTSGGSPVASPSSHNVLPSPSFDILVEVFDRPSYPSVHSAWRPSLDISQQCHRQRKRQKLGRPVTPGNSGDQSLTHGSLTMNIAAKTHARYFHQPFFNPTFHKLAKLNLNVYIPNSSRRGDGTSMIQHPASIPPIENLWF